MCPIAYVSHHPCPHLDLCIIVSMCPISHVPIAHVHYQPCAPLHICPISYVPMCPISHVPITLSLILMCLISHVFHCSCASLPSPYRSRRGIYHIAHMPHYPCFHGKWGSNMSKCQKISSCQKDVKKKTYFDYGGGLKK